MSLVNFFFGGRTYSIGLASLPPSSPWAFESEGDLWSAVSSSELNEVPDNGPPPTPAPPIPTGISCQPPPSISSPPGLTSESSISLLALLFSLSPPKHHKVQIRLFSEVSPAAPKMAPGDIILVLQGGCGAAAVTLLQVANQGP